MSRFATRVRYRVWRRQERLHPGVGVAGIRSGRELCDSIVRGEYYLQMQLVHVPSVMGTRQNIMTELPAAIEHNRRVYMKYLSMTVSKDSNKLVLSVFRGLSDRFTVAGIKAAAVVYVAFTAPFVNVVHSVAKRPQLKDVYDVAEGVIAALPDLPAPDTYASEMIKIYPDWKDSLDGWQAHRGPYLQRVYGLCTEGEDAPLVKAYLLAASTAMDDALARNRDDSCAGDANHDKAPTVSDAQESAYGALDGVMDLSRASIFACIGQAQVMRMHLFETKAEKREKSLEHARKRRKTSSSSGAGAEGGGGASSAEPGEEWSMTDFFAWPAEERWELICHLVKNFDVLCVLPEQQQVKAQHNETARRRDQKIKKKGVTQKNKHMRYREYEKKEEAKTETGLRALLQKREVEARAAGGRGGGRQTAAKEAAAAAAAAAARLAELVTQIQIRKHVYGVFRPVAVKWSGGGVDAADLEEKVIAMIKSRPERRPECPPAIAEWQRVSNPNAERSRLDGQWRVAEAVANRELGALMAEGKYFIARKKANPGQVQRKVGGAAAAAGGKKRKAKPREANGSERALVDVGFEEEGTDWVVHDVRYEELTDQGGEDCSCVIVLYYEKGGGVGAGGDEDEDAMEWSTVAEVKKWIKESST
jgi:hypothetical protein